MIKKNRFKEKLYLMTYDKPGLNRRAFTVKNSLEEVRKSLQGKEPSKKKS